MSRTSVPLGARRRHPSERRPRFGGTSVTMLERAYAHLLDGSAKAARQRLDAFAASEEEAANKRFGH